MRSIKFRGKRVSDGKWIVGSLVNNMFVKAKDSSPCCYIINPETPEYYDCWEDIASYIDEFEVIPETVGQYTFCVDNEGKEIYPGDVVEVLETDIIRIIEWNDDALEYEAVTPLGDICRLTKYNAKNQLKIVGNIHDNQLIINKPNTNDNRDTK